MSEEQRLDDSLIAAMPDFVAFLRRDGTVLRHLGGRHLGLAGDDAPLAGRRLEELWDESVAQQLRHAVRRALSTRGAETFAFVQQGRSFEALVAALYEERSRKGLPGFALSGRIEGYWNSKDTEIDLVALNEPERHIRFGFCKRSEDRLLSAAGEAEGHVARFLDAHPVYRAFMDLRVSRNFSRDEVREHVIPTYMGLIRQIDDQLGRLFAFLKDRGLEENTLIVFTSDHGDYLGDHWLGEKDLFHEMSVKVPMIVVDPSSTADATRGTVCDALIEAIDLTPTFIEYFGGTSPRHIVEGKSLAPWLRGEKPERWRECVFSEYDFSMQDVRGYLNLPVDKCRLFMAFDGRWKYVHAPGFRPMLFDLESDPQEFVDRGADPACEDIRGRMRDMLMTWALTDHNRITIPDSRIESYSSAQQLRNGILIGYWDEKEVEDARRKLGQS